MDAIAESAKNATEEHFQHATDCFSQGDALQATQHLCSAIVCSITAIAAQRGWPHSDKDDDLNAVVGLATGILPAEDDDIYQLLMSASEPGLDLNSAFAAAMDSPIPSRPASTKSTPGPTRTLCSLPGRPWNWSTNWEALSHDDRREAPHHRGVHQTLR